MTSLTDQQLLREYAASRSEPAFAELARRHVDLIYSAALRMVRDAHLAEDVTQRTFMALAQNARQLAEHSVLSGWLHLTARNLAAKVVRADVRRRAREQEAAAMNELPARQTDEEWKHIAPHLDAALAELNEPDRDALMLRYFERKSAQEMGQIQGISAEAAQKRVNRAVERLRELIARHGVSVGAGGLIVMISANAVQAAPIGLSAILTAAAMAGASTATVVTTQSTIITMSLFNIKSIAAIAAAALVAGTGTYFVQQREVNRLRGENQNLLAQADNLAKERDKALSAANAGGKLSAQSQKDKDDLLRLRNEVGALRKHAGELEGLRVENGQMKAVLSKLSQSNQSTTDSPEDDPARQAAVAKLKDARLLVLGLLLHANDNQGQYATNLSQLSPYLDGNSQKLSGSNQFELVIRGAEDNLTNASTTIAVREKQATLIGGKWVKAYGFADGHSEIKTQPDEGFDAWEAQHMVPPSQ